MAYEKQCGSCANFEDSKGKPYNKSNPNYVKGFCNWYRSYYYPNDRCESHYRSRNGSGSDCYITTIICEKLGYDDHCDSLDTMRKFRDTVLQKDEKYQNILYEYDVVGPKIAEELRDEDVDLVQDLYNGFILPIVLDIKSNHFNEAISKYVIMTKCLEESYGIDYQNEVPKNYDYHNGGHGIIKTKKYRLAI